MKSGEVHVIMGPNGSGKSTLAHAMSGRPGYKVLGGSVSVSYTHLDVYKRQVLTSWHHHFESAAN